MCHMHLKNYDSVGGGRRAARTRTAGGERWAVGGGRWAVGGGRRAVGGRRAKCGCSMGVSLWVVGWVPWSALGGRLSAMICQPELQHGPLSGPRGHGDDCWHLLPSLGPPYHCRVSPVSPRHVSAGDTCAEGRPNQTDVGSVGVSWPTCGALERSDGGVWRRGKDVRGLQR